MAYVKQGIKFWGSQDNPSYDFWLRELLARWPNACLNDPFSGQVSYAYKDGNYTKIAGIWSSIPDTPSWIELPSNDIEYHAGDD